MDGLSHSQAPEAVSRELGNEPYYKMRWAKSCSSYCLAQYEENSDKLPFLDVLNRLEKYLDMELTNQWLDIRKIRNQLAYEAVKPYIYI